jgi:hypothetical protein
MGQSHFLPDLGMDIPPDPLQGRDNIFGADVAFGNGIVGHTFLKQTDS